jgi:hypothetical protein
MLGAANLNKLFMLSVILLTVVALSVVMLNVVAPLSRPEKLARDKWSSLFGLFVRNEDKRLRCGYTGAISH